MTRRFLKILALTGLAFMATALFGAQPQSLSEVKIQQLDRQLTQHKTQYRNFHTKQEFKHRMKRPTVMHHLGQQYRSRPYRYDRPAERHYVQGRYRERYSEAFYGIPRSYHVQYGRGHRHPRRGWVLAYRYDRAAFYDRDGFYYSYFNRYGYYFEGVFYRYDRFYTYRDRLRGRGLFDRYFYRPADYRYYGFCP
ncbi:hypothetical protein [Sulfurovum sp.]|uniref:hypothetical protein n=1 Tax=Sulfurovum sp. TaxID=1969726 RepID=UPI0025E6F9BD|nr:hypothetical protein [Sulfurovum sp.]